MDSVILHFFEGLRSSATTVLAGAFSLLGETLPLVVLICIIYWLVDKRWGERLVLTSFSSLAVNGFLKTVVSRPRPYVAGVVSRVDVDNPLLSTVDLHGYESFPSGHSQMSAGLFFATALEKKRKRIWLLAPVLTLGVMCSRLYLGVHYPTDVLTGTALGIGFAFLWQPFYGKLYEKRYFLAAGFALLSLVLLLISPSKNLAELSGCMCASAIAVPIENKWVGFTIEKGWKKKLFRALIGFACVGGVFGIFALLPWQWLWIKWLKYALLIFSAALLAPWLFKKAKV